MRTHIAVCPFDEGLLQRLRGRKKIVETIGLEETLVAIRHVNSAGTGDLHCLSARAHATLADVPVTEEWKDVPIALHCPSLGRFPEVVGKLPLLRECNLRVYLSGGSERGLTGLRILSSLGVEGAVDFHDETIRWDEVSDLMTYSFFGLAPHAVIEPFHFVAQNYDAQKRTDFGSVYFDDPRRFVYVDPAGRVALSREDREAGRFIGATAEDDVDLSDIPEYLEHLERWRTPFLESTGCAFCPGWRVCPGTFSRGNGDKGCRAFFTGLIDAVEQSQKQKRTKATWRP